MFSWKRKTSSGSVGSTSHAEKPNQPRQSSEPPRPILKTAVSDQGSATRGIRFAPSAGGVWDAPAPDTSKHAINQTATVGGESGFRGNANGQGGGGQPLFHRTPPPPQLKIQIHQANLQRQSASLESMGMVSSPTRSVSRTKSTSPRRSSRPASPSATSFGHRIRTESAPSSSASCSSPMQYHPSQFRESMQQRSFSGTTCSSPAGIHPSHVTTPPTVYCPTTQAHAPPPPSPYRPTTTQERHWIGSRALPEQLPMTREMAPRPPRHSSLFPSAHRSSRVGSRPTSGASLLEVAGVDVPMLNIIPATPQDHSDEFTRSDTGGPSRRRMPEELADPITIHRMTEISLAAEESEEISTQSLPKSDSTPEINVELDFSPFSPTIELALDDYAATSVETERSESEIITPAITATAEQTPSHEESSPPFESYSSLPSLSSQSSLQSDQSLKSSSSMASVMSFPDVEEALGSMLASLSDGNMATIEAEMAMTPSFATDKDARQRAASAPPTNPGLGLGLDLPETTSFMTAPLSLTSPLSPRKSKPGKIDTALAQSTFTPSTNGVPQTAPPVINHRVAFYGTARAHPNSPNSGVFTRSLDDIASHSNGDGIACGSSEDVRTPTMPPRLPSSGALSTASRDSVSTVSQGTIGCRDSISAHSESSDEDLHTASIINLTPVAGRSFAEVRGEEIIVDEVGLAL